MSSGPRRVIVSFTLAEAEALASLHQYSYANRHIERGLRKLVAGAKWAKEKRDDRCNAGMSVAKEQDQLPEETL